MKHNLEVFFDYACPFCYRAYQSLKELIPEFPNINIIWQLCEAHPRPDRYGPHSDLCIQGYFYAKEHGVDAFSYHDRMFQATMVDRIDIEDLELLTNYVQDLVDANDFRLALQQGSYSKALMEANELAYQQNGVWAVPAYRCVGKKLDAVENVGVTKQELQRFLEGFQ